MSTKLNYLLALLALGLVFLVAIESKAEPDQSRNGPIGKPCSTIAKMSLKDDEQPCVECCQGYKLRMKYKDWASEGGKCACYAPWPRSRDVQEQMLRYEMTEASLS